eukprot:7383865-Prymnesium_polylepis.1
MRQDSLSGKVWQFDLRSCCAGFFDSSLIARCDVVQMTNATYRQLPQGDPWSGAALTPHGLNNND